MGQLMDWYNQNQQAMAQQQAYSGLGAAIGGTLGNYANPLMQQQYNPYQNTGTAATTNASTISYGEYERLLEKAIAPVKKAASKVWKKTNNFLVDLRHEIDEWHGDVLMRAA